MPGTARFLLLISMALTCATARAASFCISSQAELVAALNAAKANGQNDILRVRAGNYLLSTNLVFITGEANSISLSGGWNANCMLSNVSSTTLDGDGQYWILYMYSSAASSITVSDITFISGRITGGSNNGAGLHVQSEGSITVERNEFIGNESVYNTGGLYVGTSGTLMVRNNLLLINKSPFIGGAQLIANGDDAIVSNNTIVGNVGTDTNSNTTGGLLVGGSAHFVLSNNLIYFNTDLDFNNQSLGSSVACNDMGLVGGLAFSSGGSFGNIDVDPGFAPGLFSVRLASDSPLVNAGTNTPAGGVGIYDADGEPRLQGGHVDIGAYETDVLFYNGVETPPDVWP